MKLAIWHNLPSGGAKRALHDQVKGLLNRGHQVEAWCPPTAGRSYLPLADLIPEHVVPVPVEAPHRKFVNRMALRPYQPGTSYRAMREHCRVCAEQINSGGFDVFLGNACVEYRVAPIARYIRVPSALYLGEPFRWFYEALPELPWLAPEISGTVLNPVVALKALRELAGNRHLRILARQESESAKAYGRVLTNSRYSRESILKAYGIDAKVCYLGIDPDLFTLLDLERDVVVVGVGSFDRIKNIEFVLRAVALLSDLRPRLTWVGNSGDPQYMAELSALANELGVDYDPRLMITDKQLVEVLNSARVMAYAPRLEPFGLTPLEANCCGVPVVAVAEGGVRESITHGENGLLVDAEPDAMARALRPFLEDAEQALAFGLKARRWVADHWSLPESITRLENELLSVREENSR